MKTKILTASFLLLSAAVMAQNTSVQSAAQAQAKAEHKQGENNKAVIVNGQVTANQSVQTDAVTAAKEGVVTSSAKVKAKAKKAKDKTQAAVQQTGSAIGETVSQTAVSADVHSEMSLVAGNNNPVAITNKVTNSTLVSPAGIQTVTAGDKTIQAPVKTIQASSKTLLSNGTIVQPKPLMLKNNLVSTNSTLLKLK